MKPKAEQENGLEVAIVRALSFAGLPREALRMGPNPDTGEPSWVLDATIQQYSGFLVSLATQFRRASAMEAIVGSVRMEAMFDDRTLFWIENLTAPRPTR